MAFPGSPDVLVPFGSAVLAVTILLFVIATRGWRADEAGDFDLITMNVGAEPHSQGRSASTEGDRTGWDAFVISPAAETIPTEDVLEEIPVTQSAAVPQPRSGAEDAPAQDDPRDALLAVLLPDPSVALRATVEFRRISAECPDLCTTHDRQRRELGAAVRALLNCGLTPAQVARLCGVGDDELTGLVVDSLGGITAAPGPVATD